MTSEKERMLAGQLCDAGDAELTAMRLEARQEMKLSDNGDDRGRQRGIIKSLFGSTNEKLTMNPCFVCGYDSNIYVGENFYTNCNCTMLDVCTIHIDDNAMFGPSCQLLTPLHLLDAKGHISGPEYGAPITVGDDAWFGGGVTILPGVILGDNVVVDTDAIVTRSFGNNVVFAGDPARIIKTLD